jgi:hypothetical protein
MNQENSNTFQTKLKNKKKDVIVADISTVAQNAKPVNEGTLPHNSIINEISSNTNTESTHENKQTFNTQKVEGNVPSKNNQIEDNDSSKNLINKIILNLQFLLSISNKVDAKLLNLCSFFLSTEHFQSILEERDCREICGNMLCDKKIMEKASHGKKYTYYYNVQQFSKENPAELFCDMICFQKFKDAYAVAKKFDYFRLLHIDTIILFYILTDYYPNNIYLTENKLNAEKILNSFKKNRKIDITIERVKEKYNDYFFEEKLIEGQEKNEEIGKVLEEMFENNLNVKG